MKKDLMSLEMIEIQPLDDEALSQITGGCGGMDPCSLAHCSGGYATICGEENAASFGGEVDNNDRSRGTVGG